MTDADRSSRRSESSDSGPPACSRRRRWLAMPPLRPASRASSLVHSCAVPFWCAALPPLLAISRCLPLSIEANPRSSLATMCLPPVSGGSSPDEFHRSSLPRVLQQRYHEHIDSLGDSGASRIRARVGGAASQMYRRGALCQVDSETQSEFWAHAYSLMSSCAITAPDAHQYRCVNLGVSSPVTRWRGSLHSRSGDGCARVRATRGLRTDPGSRSCR